MWKDLQTAFAWSGQKLIKRFPTAYKPVSNWTQVEIDWTLALYLAFTEQVSLGYLFGYCAQP
jgi:hypothetical protein